MNTLIAKKFTITQEQWDQLSLIAKEKTYDRSLLLREILRDYLENFNKTKTKQKYDKLL